MLEEKTTKRKKRVIAANTISIDCFPTSGKNVPKPNSAIKASVNKVINLSKRTIAAPSPKVIPRFLRKYVRENSPTFPGDNIPSAYE